jgi:hypothetical protein
MANTEYPNVATHLAKGNGESGYIIPAVIPATDTAGQSTSVAYDAAAWNDGALLSGLGVGIFVYATTDCHANFGSAATITAATTAQIFIPGGVWLQLPYAAIKTVSAIKATAAGTIYVSEIVP